MPLTVEHRVPMEIDFTPTWLTWVASTTACLRALGSDCDAVDVAGHTGYAFILNIHEELCASGSMGFDLSLLNSGIPSLGRSPLLYVGGQHYEGDHISPVMNEQWRFAYDLVYREVEAGRPCVLYGPYAPEFAVTVGVGDGHYWVRSFKEALEEPQPAVSLRALEAPGGLYLLSFPTVTDVDPVAADRRAIEHAVEMMTWRAGSPWYMSGLAAYDQWMAALATDKADAFGNAFNARCWAEARGYARDFIGRVAERAQPHVAGSLAEARAALAESAAALTHIVDLCPLHPRDYWMIEDARGEAVEELADAKAADGRTLAALERAVGIWNG